MNVTVIGNEALRIASDCFCISGCSLNYLNSYNDDSGISEETELIITDTSCRADKTHKIAGLGKKMLLIDYDENENFEHSNIIKINYRCISENEDLMTYAWNLADLMFKACNE